MKDGDKFIEIIRSLISGILVWQQLVDEDYCVIDFCIIFISLNM